MISKRLLTISVLSTLSVHAMAQGVPNIFSPDTPAKASEVNENFDFLASNSIGANLINGEISTDVDCTSNAAALNEAYAEYVNYREINFQIKGNCYGDITVKRSFDEQNNWDNATYQVHGQTINIYPQIDQTAGLIPNDLSGNVAIWGSFGGGLYLNDLTITLGSEWDYGAAYSRNGHGAVTNVTIVGPNTANGAGIWVQEGGQVYVNGVNMSNVIWGIYAVNNATVRLLDQTTTISSQSDSIKVIAANVRQQADLFLTSETGRSLSIESGSHWNGWGKNITVTGGEVYVGGGSTFKNEDGGGITSSGQVNIEHSSFEATIFSSGNLMANKSNVYATNLTTGNLNLHMAKAGTENITATALYLSNSTLHISGGSVSGGSTITDKSYLNANSTTFNDMSLYQNSFLYGNGLTVNAVLGQDNSLVDLRLSTVNADININTNSTGAFHDVTFNGSSVNIDKSKARITGSTKAPTNKLICTGLSIVEYEDVSDILNTEPNSNCLDQSSVNTLMSIIKSNHLTPM
ncbi:hypothetical protein [Pseudoalteromonas spongiae]|uniref:hypothetical protein n=1 Tax=Pseudoalteromonas spongiae TaxID=298657 RepID=UPI00110AF32C|nr:hypothetical protein [Pseudoalteromonas spongiae]TMO82179.1 hypothetical protein CWC15_20000 [Pseudoalteromonas spongiae]